MRRLFCYVVVMGTVLLTSPVVAMESNKTQHDQNQIENQFSNMAINASKKRKLSEVDFQFQSAKELGYQPKRKQMFSPPIYDQTAKYVFKENEQLRIYLLSALSGINNIIKADILDDHLNPLNPYFNLRKLLNSNETKDFFNQVAQHPEQHPKCLQDLASHFEDLRASFPLPDRNSQVDFLCKTNEGHYITIEFQLAKQDFWDSRALAYVSSIYGNQLKKGGKWEDLNKVIGINLLGDGSTPYWNTGEFRRHYAFQNQLDHHRKIDGIELIQYSLGDVNLQNEDLLKNKPLHDTLRFFKNAANETKVPEDIDEILKRAYELVNVEYLKINKPELYQLSEDFFEQYDLHNKELFGKGLIEGIEKGKQEGLAEGEARGIEKGREEGAINTARNMIAKAIGDNKLIADITGLTEEQIEKLRE